MAAFWNHMDQVMKRGHYGHYHEELFFLKDPVFGCDGMIFCLKCTSILDLHAIYIYISQYTYITSYDILIQLYYPIQDISLLF